MKNILKQTIWLVFGFLIFANVFLFINGMRLSHEINEFESKIQAFHKENLELEQKAYLAESLSHAASMAAQLEFTKKSNPLYLNDKAFAKGLPDYGKN